MILTKEDSKTEESSSKLQEINFNHIKIDKNIFINCLVISLLKQLDNFFSLFNNGYYYFYYIFFSQDCSLPQIRKGLL